VYPQERVPTIVPRTQHERLLTVECLLQHHVELSPQLETDHAEGQDYESVVLQPTARFTEPTARFTEPLNGIDVTVEADAREARQKSVRVEKAVYDEIVPLARSTDERARVPNV
jgi:hypothetical protein